MNMEDACSSFYRRDPVLEVGESLFEGEDQELSRLLADSATLTDIIDGTDVAVPVFIEITNTEIEEILKHQRGDNREVGRFSGVFY